MGVFSVADFLLLQDVRSICRRVQGLQLSGHVWAGKSFDRSLWGFLQIHCELIWGNHRGVLEQQEFLVFIHRYDPGYDWNRLQSSKPGSFHDKIRLSDCMGQRPHHRSRKLLQKNHRLLQRIEAYQGGEEIQDCQGSCRRCLRDLPAASWWGKAASVLAYLPRILSDVSWLSSAKTNFLASSCSSPRYPKTALSADRVLTKKRNLRRKKFKIKIRRQKRQRTMTEEWNDSWNTWIHFKSWNQSFWIICTKRLWKNWKNSTLLRNPSSNPCLKGTLKNWFHPIQGSLMHIWRQARALQPQITVMGSWFRQGLLLLRRRDRYSGLGIWIILWWLWMTYFLVLTLERVINRIWFLLRATGSAFRIFVHHQIPATNY